MHALLHSLRKGSKGRAVDSQTEDSCARTINEMQARIDGASHGRSLLAQSSGADSSAGADEELKQHAAFARRATEWLTIRDFGTTKECIDALRADGAPGLQLPGLRLCGKQFAPNRTLAIHMVAWSPRLPRGWYPRPH